MLGTERRPRERPPNLLPDVVVMDVMMPKKDGAEACREIMDALPDTRVVILTASTEEDAVIQAVAASGSPDSVPNGVAFVD